MPKHFDEIRVVAFDLDGTLVDTAPDLAAAVNMMLTMLGGKALPEDQIRLLIGNGVETLVARSLNNSFGGEPEQKVRSAAHSPFARLYSQHLFVHGRVYPGVTETLTTLHRAGIALCCITNKDSAFALPLLEAARLREHFSFILCADRLEDRKPSPKLLLAACSRLSVSPQEVLYVGDSQTDIRTARAASCRIAVVDYGYNHGLPFDDPKPDAIVSNLWELVTMCKRPLTAGTAKQGAVLKEIS